MTCSFGKCDHFTMEEEGVEHHCYVTTEFYRCSSLFPVRSYIATGSEERVSGENVFTFSTAVSRNYVSANIW